jgi:hypothetical protein
VTSNRGRVRRFQASVAYLDSAGVETEEKFPVVAADPDAARDLAVAYVLTVLKLKDFELRIIGA